MTRPGGTVTNVSEMSVSLWTPGWGRGGNVPIVVDTLVFDEGQITSPQNGNIPTWGGVLPQPVRECREDGRNY